MTIERSALIAAASVFLLAAASSDTSHGPQMITAAMATAVAVAVATPFAIALGRIRFEGRAFAFGILILASATSPALLGSAGTAPLEHFAHGLALGTPLATWIVYLQARQLPHGLEDAIVLDGASRLRVWVAALRPALLVATPLVFFLCAFDL